jgi:cell division protein FtsL
MAQVIGSVGARIGTLPRVPSRRRARRGRWLESFSTVGLGILALVCALFYVWQHIWVLRMGYEIERLRETRAALVQEHKALRLDLGQLKSLRRVEEIARTQLGMVTPKPGQVVLIPESTIQ